MALAMGVTASAPAEPERGTAGLRPLAHEVGSRRPKDVSKPEREGGERRDDDDVGCGLPHHQDDCPQMTRMNADRSEV
jgi:hypothetical protein